MTELDELYVDLCATNGLLTYVAEVTGKENVTIQDAADYLNNVSFSKAMTYNEMMESLNGCFLYDDEE